MKHKLSMILCCALITLMVGSNQVTGVSAGNSFETPITDTSAVTDFTYKGHLTENGNPANSDIDPFTPLLSRQELNSPFESGSNSDGVGRSDHNHLGQTWTGFNPLVINGSFGGPWYAPLVLSNDFVSEESNGSGLLISSAARDGVTVDNAGVAGFRVVSANQGLVVQSANKNGLYVWSARTGVYVQSASGLGLLVEESGDDGLYIGNSGWDAIGVETAANNGLSVGSTGVDGVYVQNAGNNGVTVDSASSNGLWVGNAGVLGVGVDYASEVAYWVNNVGGSGLWVGNSGGQAIGVGYAGENGVLVDTSHDNGLYVKNAGLHGVQVDSASGMGLYVDNAGIDGVHINSASGYAGWFGGSIYASGGCVGCTITMFGINSGDTRLQPGDIVSIQGLLPSEFAGTTTLMQVKATEDGETVIGVVQGWAEVTEEKISQDGIPGSRLVPRQEAAEPGDYVTIIIYGPAQVKSSALSGPISAGMRLAIGQDRGVRALQTVEVNGVQIAESTSTIGIALEGSSAKPLIWVLVNPQ